MYGDQECCQLVLQSFAPVWIPTVQVTGISTQYTGHTELASLSLAAADELVQRPCKRCLELLPAGNSWQV